jgi:formate dehydrogenase major subunit
MTTNLIDIQNSDVVMATSNMAENHPVGFQWVLRAKERGAKFIHVDPRFTRTSALADIHVPLRSGTNIVFFGGLINYAIAKKKFFHDYVVEYTNASFLIDPEFKTPTDLAGLFTGFDPQGRKYDRATWRYQLDEEGNPKRDKTLTDPNTVWQLLKRHYSRYSLEMVERVCGIPRAKFEEVAALYCSTGAPDKSGSITYA